MGFFSNWPFSNLHNINLDWLIEQVKKLTVVTDQIWERVKPIPGGDPSTITAAQAYNAASLAQDTADRASQSATTANTAINNHTANKNNPHDVTPQQIGAEPAIGILDLSKGGTGADNPASARASLGARADFTILPVSDGGTGSSTPEGARSAIGAKADFDILPVAQGGTGASNGADACANIGAKPNFSILPVAQGGTGATDTSGALAALEGLHYVNYSNNASVDTYLGDNNYYHITLYVNRQSVTDLAFLPNGSIQINGKNVTVTE